MTPPKIWYAQKLAALRNDGSDPETLAKDLTIRRMCYEIEKLEEETETPPPAPPNEEKIKKKRKKVKSFWSRLVLESSSSESDSDLEESKPN